MRRWRASGALVVLGAMIAASSASAANLQCGDELNSNAKLKHDLTCGVGQGGLAIDANGVRLDLNGHTISGNFDIGTAGVCVGDFNRATITGGTIRSFGEGVFADGADDLTVTHLKVKNMAEQSLASARSTARRSRTTGSARPARTSTCSPPACPGM